MMRVIAHHNNNYFYIFFYPHFNSGRAAYVQFTLIISFPRGRKEIKRKYETLFNPTPCNLWNGLVIDQIRLLSTDPHRPSLTLNDPVKPRTYLGNWRPDLCGEINTIYTQIKSPGQYGGFNTDLINWEIWQSIEWTG